ncbi:MAG: DUF3857 and transglutaminase domain-containing protein [Bacteroidetes bacterium]|nr:DUF3857 and transglutaminase domain-containing protein [Bacteroidota bacterium]
MRKFWLPLLGVLFGLTRLWAGPVEDLVKKAGTAADFPDNGKLVIFDSTRVEVQESGLSFFFTHSLYKILTPAGALDLAVVKYDYDPQTALSEIRKVVIYRKEGSMEVLDMTKVLDYPAPARAIYWGAREKMLAVGRLEPGDAVEVFLFKKGFTYALLEGDDENYIPPMRGNFYDIVPFWTEDPMLEKVYQVSLPADKKLNYKVYNGELVYTEEKNKDQQRFTWTGKSLMPMKTESGMVAKSDVGLKLLLSTSPDWQSKSVWFYGVNEDFGSFTFSPEIKAKVDEILKGALDELDSISRLTHWCGDEIRYSGISMGKGEGYTLHKGDMTFTDRAGVCKDKAGMLITMLRAAGFRSYPAMTMAGSRIDRIVADQFNHCVTIVQRRNGQYQLLDPTWVPFTRELWSSAEQQQNYLMGVPEGADLMETPLSPPEAHYLRIEGNSQILPDGTLMGGFRVTAEGQSDAAIRRIFTGGYKARWKQQLEKELLRISPAAIINMVNYADNTKQDPYNYVAGPILLEFQYTIPGFALVTGKEIIFTSLIASNLFKSAQGQLNFSTNSKEKKFPFRDRCSREVEITETINLPYPCHLTVQPAVQPVSGTICSYSGKYEMTDRKDVIKMNQKIVLGKRVYEPADWTDFRQIVENQNKMAEQKVILAIDKK